MNKPLNRFYIKNDNAIHWSAALFHEVFDFLSSKPISRDQLNYEAGVCKNIHYGDILTKLPSIVEYNSPIIPYVNSDIDTRLFSSLNSGDIVIADTAEDYMVGTAVEVSVNDGEVITAGLHTMACRPKIKFAKSYLGYYLNSPAFHNQLKRLVTGSKVLAINKSEIINTVIKFPSFEEQQKIAEFFTALDEKIRIKRAHIMQTEKLKTYVMKQVFSGQMRFGYKVKWTEKKFKDVLDIERGSSPRPISKYLCDSEDGLNWIKIGDAPIKGNRITSAKEKILPSGLKQSRMVHKGELLLSNSMSFGRPYILEVDGCIHDGWLVIRNHNNIFNLDFLVYLLASDEVKKQYKKLAGHGVVSNLNKDLVSEVILRYPPLNEQNTIAQMLNSVDNKIALQKNQLESLEKLKKAFMQRMFV